MIDDTKFVRDGPAFENHHTRYDPMGIYWMKKKINIQQGWRHHADLPLPGIQNSHPVFSIMAQPWQGSQRVDTWRKLIQHFLHAKYNFPVRFRLGLVYLSITWVVAEKGKGDKWLVWQNENLKNNKNMFF